MNFWQLYPIFSQVNGHLGHDGIKTVVVSWHLRGADLGEPGFSSC